MSNHLVDDIVSDALDGNAWIEIGVAFLAYFILSWLWWGPLMGKKWAGEMGMDMTQKPDGKTMGIAMVLQAVGTFLLAFVLWHVMTAFTVDTEADVASNPSVGMALEGVFYMWLGFFVPAQLGKVAWEKASWTLAGINAAGHLIALAGMGVAFALL